MEKQTKNLGHVTAYGYAKSQGYEGTEAEYAQLMASYATVAERAETAAESAEQSAQEVHDVIPEVTAQDNGKVMMVENGEWGAGEVDVLPPVTSQDNGKVLGVVAGQWSKTEPEDGLPEVTSEDNGKVLSVVEGAWAPAEAGSGLPEVTSADNGDLLSVVNGAWAKSEPGYRVERSETEIAPEQSVTTAMRFGVNRGYTQDYTELTLDTAPETLRVTWNGTEYTVPLVGIGGEPGYGEETDGDFVFSTYPFALLFRPKNDPGLEIQTPEAGTYTIAITEQSTTVTLDDDFKLAVNNSYMETTDSEKEAIPEQSVTTAVQGDNSYADGDVNDFTLPADVYADAAWPDTMRFTFNGTEYELPRVGVEVLPVYGGGWSYDETTGINAPDFTTYPFMVEFGEDQGVGGYYTGLFTPNAGTYTIEATYTEATTAPTEKFKEAVRQSGGGALIVNDDGGSLDKTWQEIFDAYTSGTAVVIRKEYYNGDSTQSSTEVIYSVTESVSTNMVVDQGEETVTYYVTANGDHYSTSSATDYPATNFGGGGQ